MKLSENFTLKELTVTSIRLANVPNTDQVENLKQLVKKILQPLRDAYGMPIKITSGFRSLAVNTKIGGSSSSQHTKGQAADFVCRDNAKAFRIIRDSLLFDQLIWEKGDDMEPEWVHVSFKEFGNRRQVLRFDGHKYSNM
ncbi:D-Ala-D-Ala carboxypeptidase family metallohydrolase [Labilibaculum euxinus]